MLKRRWVSCLFASVLTFTSVTGVVFENSVQAAATNKDYESHAAKAAIDFGIQKGYLWLSGGKFYPNNQITQGQFVASLVAIRGVKETAAVPQLPAGHWAKYSYERAVKAGILNNVKIDPNKPLTKEEAALLVFNTWWPYRGEKSPDLTNTGALITWGWMKPAPRGQPKFREDLPVLRSDAAEILQFMWQDKWQLEQGKKYADEFHKSLKVVNGKITGKVPKGDGNFLIRAMFNTKADGLNGFLNNESFAVPVNSVKSLTFQVINAKDSTSAGGYWYPNLPKFDRENRTKKFYR
ncbi:S-layer homology domain-containing protein [Brevibacillus agri]|uniref:S-layer homology domain-containing protein n=1 Tax=Brevibacillus agri TaxID=51101 RepID=UPI001EE5BA55|nr:S-layer homology domain-containing protein [Brevibacillus agri]MCG5250268.1 S-layer homology domain-containing protein [Brevibacillus agri]